MYVMRDSKSSYLPGGREPGRAVRLGVKVFVGVKVFPCVAVGRGVRVGVLVSVPPGVNVNVGEISMTIMGGVAVFVPGLKIKNGSSVATVGRKVGGEKVFLGVDPPLEGVPSDNDPACDVTAKTGWVAVSVSGTLDPASTDGSNSVGASVAAGGSAVEMPGSVPSKRYLNGVDVSV